MFFNESSEAFDENKKSLTAQTEYAGDYLLLHLDDESFNCFTGGNSVSTCYNQYITTVKWCYNVLPLTCLTILLFSKMNTMKLVSEII